MKDKASTSTDSTTGETSPSPWQMLVYIVKVVPVMKFALAVVGLVAIAAIVSAWKMDVRVAVFGSFVILGLMVILALFARVLVRSGGKPDREFLYYASVFIVCVFGLLVTLAAVFLLTASAFGWPRPLHDLLFPPRPVVLPNM